MASRYIHRDDPRFAHPDIRDYYSSLRAVDLRNADVQYNPKMPDEERIANAKSNYEYMKAMFPAQEFSDRTKTITVPGYEGEADAPDVEIVVSRPESARGRKLPCVFLIPGGGMQSCMEFVTNPETEADQTGAVVIRATYRTINDPNGLYPAAINDLHAIYAYAVDHADELGINPEKIVLFGESTGGHLALSLAHRLKNNGYAPRGCVALVPVIDERAIYPSSEYVSNIWNGRDIYAYGQFWTDRVQSCLVPAEAFANHATVDDCLGLCPTIIYTAEHEACVDPCLEYVSKLIQAGVFTSLHLWGGGGHELTSATGEGYPERVHGQVYTDLRDLMENDFRRPWLDEL